jgi:hypothetical protein
VSCTVILILFLDLPGLLNIFVGKSVEIFIGWSIHRCCGFWLETGINASQKWVSVKNSSRLDTYADFMIIIDDYPFIINQLSSISFKSYLMRQLKKLHRARPSYHFFTRWSVERTYKEWEKKMRGLEKVDIYFPDYLFTRLPLYVSSYFLWHHKYTHT